MTSLRRTINPRSDGLSLRLLAWIALFGLPSYYWILVNFGSLPLVFYTTIDEPVLRFNF